MLSKQYKRAKWPGAHYNRSAGRWCRQLGIDRLHSRTMNPVSLTLSGVVLSGLLMAPLPVAAQGDNSQDSGKAQRQLEAVQSQIGKLERQLENQTSKRGDAEKSLRDAERGESRVRRNLAEIKAALSATRQRLAKLEAEAASIRSELAGQIDTLEKQIRSAWVSGRDDWLRSVLSQEDPAEIGRQLVYHSYIAQGRTELIDSIRGDLDRLSAAQAAVARERSQLEETQATEQERLAELAVAREQRRTALAKIDAGLASQTQQIDRLRSQAEDLEVLVAELTQILSALPLGDFDSFSQRQGVMQLPTSGRVVRKFGQAKADGRMRWNGILVGAAAGAEVRAVHHGRVVFSDWLPGMGLLVVLEHGDGYLSLYGHNQDLMTAVGDWVDPNSVIAHVGDSGGQAITGLYFEIRKNGAPQNPARWLAP
jgi:septal ring factor EnvC (AmiA/AmiB activator)